LVRIPADGSEPVQAMIKQVLDVGAHGIVVPHVRTAQQARKIISAFRYPQPEHSKNPIPIGVRGASPWLCSYLWGLSSEAYVKRADVWPLNPDGDLLAVLMIEDVEGAENIDDILQVKGVGAVLFGPYDFSFSIGHPGETDHPKLVQYREKVKKACERANVPLIGFANPDNILSKIEEDYKILLIGHDVRNDGSVVKVIEQIKDRY
jgi:4-hydroxy-2-oxoheptanedioate aldolase